MHLLHWQEDPLPLSHQEARNISTNILFYFYVLVISMTIYKLACECLMLRNAGPGTEANFPSCRNKTFV